MADSEIRNPAKAYFKWKLPVIAKSEDDWNFWNTEDKYNRTLFIGYNDTTTPHVASLFLIEDGKAVQAVGDDVLARIAQMEVDISTQMAEVQQLVERANEQQQSIDDLKVEVQAVLQDCAAYADDAQTWAEGSDEDVADLGGEHSAKGWAQVAHDIVASGLPSEASFEKLEVTGSLQPEDNSFRVPNTAWVQQAVQHGTIDPDSEITCKKITTTTDGASLNATYSASRAENASITVAPATQGSTSSILLDIRTSESSYPTQLRMTSGRMWTSVPGRMDFTVGDTDSSPVDIFVGLQDYVKLPWTHGLYCDLPVHLNNGLYVKNRKTDESAFIYTNTVDDDATTNPTLYVRGSLNVFGTYTSTRGITSSLSVLAHRAKSDTDSSYFLVTAEDTGTNTSSYLDVSGHEVKLGAQLFTYFDGGERTNGTMAIRLGSAASQAYTTTRYIYSELIGKFANGLQIGLVNDYTPDGIPFKVLRSDTTTTGKWLATFGVTPTVPDIMDASDSSSNVPNTKWVQAAVAANVSSSIAGYQPKLTAGSGITISEDNVISATGGGDSGGDAVDSVNGKTGEVILSGQDIKTDPNASNTLYQDYTALSTQLTGKQDEIGQDTSLSLNTLTLADSSTGTVGKLTMASQDGTVEFAPSGTLVGSIIGRNGEGLLINASDIHIGYQFSSPTAIRLSRTDLKATHNFATDFTGAVSCSANIAADDDSIQLATTQWVNAAIAAAGGGSGGGAVSSVNGKTGEVVLSASDVGAITEADATTQIATALEPYAKTADVNTSLEGYATADALTTGLAAKQDKLTAGEGISISDENVISCTVEPATTGVTSVNGKTGKVVLSAADVGAASTSDLASYVTTNAMNTELTNYATTSAVDTKLTEYQPKLIAGEGISISDSNVISATGGGSSGGAVESINGKTGAVVLTGEDIAINTATGANTINDVVANLTSMVINKQDAITATSDLVVNSVQAAGTSSSAYLSPYALRFSTATVDMLYANSRGVYLSNLTGGYNASDTGQFDWYMNNTTDYNKFNIYSRYYTDDAEDPDIKIPNDNLIMSAGGAPGGASTWVDFTANYLSFKGAANFGEGGDDTHTMNFNGPSFFNNNVSFVKQETSGTSTALTFNKDTGGFTFITDASFQGTLIASGESTMHKLTVGDGVEGQAFILETEAELNASVKLGWNSGRLYCMRDEYNWLFDFNRSANVGERIKFNDDVRILSSMPEAADDSTIVPNTAWVQDAIDAKNARIEISSSATVTQSVKIEPLSNGTLYTVTYNGVVTSGTPIVLLAPSGGSYVGCVRLANTIAANKPNTPVQVGCADEINGSGELTVTPTLGIAEAQVTIVVTLYKAAS